MRAMVEKMIRSLGTDVTVHHEGVSVTAKGIFVPTTSRSWQNMQNVFTELGEAPRGQYNYIGAMEPVVEKGDLLDVGHPLPGKRPSGPVALLLQPGDHCI